jgi:hypothetical protein
MKMNIYNREVTINKDESGLKNNRSERGFDEGIGVWRKRIKDEDEVNQKEADKGREGD